MTIDFAPLAEAFVALLAAALTAAVPFVAPALARLLNAKLTAQETQLITNAAQHGADLAVHEAAQGAGTLTSVHIANASVATGASYVAKAFPDILKSRGITPEHVSDLVSAALGARIATQSAAEASVISTPPAAPPTPAPTPAPPAPAPNSGIIQP